LQPQVDGFTEGIDPDPLLFGVRLGDPGIFVDTADGVGEPEGHLDRISDALDRRG
jgi:hypothetical protein